MNNYELYLAYIYSPFSFNLFKKFTLYSNSPKLINTYKQTSTVIYNRLSVITDANKSASSSYFESYLRLVNSPCFHTSMHFTGGSPFYVLAPCLSQTNQMFCLQVLFVTTARARWHTKLSACEFACGSNVTKDDRLDKNN